MKREDLSAEKLVQEIKNVMRPLSPQRLEMYYSKAHSCYEIGQYKQACDIFELLVSYDPFERSFWKGLAAARQLTKEYELSLKAWAMLALLSPKCPYSHFHAAECFIALKNFDDAQAALQKCRELMKDDTHPLQSKVSLLEDTWQPQKELSLQNT